MRPFHYGVFLFCLFGPASQVLGDVDLVTLPTREGTQLTIYNSEDITMVREHRLLTLKVGVNPIQFSWANTLIDPTSIEFRVLETEDKVRVVDTTYPAGRTDALQWNVSSERSGKVPVEIRYFTSGITWTADYVGLANGDETKLTLLGYVRVDNKSGELYDNAQTRLVVGTIHLVEKIEELARRPPPAPPPKPEPTDQPDSALVNLTKSYVDKLTRMRPDEREKLKASIEKFEAEKTIVKEGLSEYFLFTIEGREEIRDHEPKRLICLKARDVPLDCLYKLSDRQGGLNVQKYYRFENKKLLDERGKEKDLPPMENLGLSPLPNGTVRLYSEDQNHDLSHLGQTTVNYVPMGDRVEIPVGSDLDVSVSRRLKDQRITHLQTRQFKKRVNDDWVVTYDLVDYDEILEYEEAVVSSKRTRVKVEVERQFDDDVVLWGSEVKPKDWDNSRPGAYVNLHGIPGRVERVDTRHVKYFLDLKPGERATVAYQVIHKRRMVGPELNRQSHRESH